MRTSKQLLPGIVKIGWVDCRHLPDRVALSAICGMKIPIFTDIHEIEFFDDPQCECVTKKEGAGFQDSVSLKFKSGLQLPKTPYLGFIVTDVNGNSFLIGSKETPFAYVEKILNTGTPSGDTAGYEYEITHVAIKSMVECII